MFLGAHSGFSVLHKRLFNRKQFSINEKKQFNQLKKTYFGLCGASKSANMLFVLLPSFEQLTITK